MHRILFIVLILAASLAEAKSSNEYLPAGADLDQAIASPESILGWDLGDWHVRHDQLVRYMESLAETSPRVSLQITGQTHEQRPLLLLAVTAPENQQNLESLRSQHLESRGKQGPLVIWMGYSVHGNEASGSNASLLFAYYLAASRDPAIESLLKGSIILIDPSINPDGLARFAHWVNGHKSKHLVDDRNNREHQEVWPQARTNHYWFDLNRDWLLLQHPESQARVAQYFRWRPHVLTDFHEQASDTTYFFQPGVPERQNPLTPELNLELTRELAKYHARALDQSGQLYFTEERFDDYYFGKGSSFPDINGSIGILFEQASARGHLMKTDNGPLSFRQAIQNQLDTSLSTINGAWEIRDKLHAYQQAFDREMSQRAANDSQVAWLVADDGDPGRIQAFLNILAQHQIETWPLQERITANGYTFNPDHAWVIPNRQRQYGLLQALLETRTQFLDATFYDVSSWTLPLAFDLPYASVKRMPATDTVPTPAVIADVALPDSVVAWALPWQHFNSARVLRALLEADLPVRATLENIALTVEDSTVSLKRGGLIVPTGMMDPQQQEIARKLLQSMASDSGIPVHGARTGLTSSGIDLGSSKIKPLKPVKPLLWIGRKISSYEAGEVWHLLDTRIGLPPVMVEEWQLKTIDLDQYSHLLMVDGDYDSVGKKLRKRIEQWVTNGGVLVSSKRAAIWAEGLFEADQDDAEDDDAETEAKTEPVSTERRAYADYDDDNAKRVIGGAIVAAEIDLTHPLAFGYQRDQLPLFRNGTVLLEPSENPYATVALYSDEPLLSGFIGAERLAEIKNQPALIAERQNKGLIIRMANNPNFRAFWYGTQRLYINALFFAQLVGETELEK